MTPDESPIFREAVEAVRRTGRASTQVLMREMHVSYLTAADLIVALEARGIISKADQSGKRTILAKE